MREQKFRGNVFVANLPKGFTDEQLAEAFDQFGIVVGAFLGRDPETGAPRRYGLVSLAPDRAATAAVTAMNGIELGGRRIEVRLADRDMALSIPSRVGAGRATQARSSSSPSPASPPPRRPTTRSESENEPSRLQASHYAPARHDVARHEPARHEPARHEPARHEPVRREFTRSEPVFTVEAKPAASARRAFQVERQSLPRRP